MFSEYRKATVEDQVCRNEDFFSHNFESDAFEKNENQKLYR